MIILPRFPRAVPRGFKMWWQRRVRDLELREDIVTGQVGTIPLLGRNGCEP